MFPWDHVLDDPMETFMKGIQYKAGSLNSLYKKAGPQAGF